MNINLPQLEDRIFLADAGLETDLIFNEGIELPHFASIVLVDDHAGRAALRRYYEKFLAIAADARCGFILDSPTWRASRDWAGPLGYDIDDLRRANERAIEFIVGIRDAQRRADHPIVINGCIGPRGDGYIAGERMSVAQARLYHRFQTSSFERAGADMVTAVTMTYPDEAVGITLAARDSGLPVAISFTTETDGRLPSGETLGEAIDRVDAVTGNGPAYYMINCAHPDHFSQALARDERWISRIRGIRANASRMSHAELDEAEVLDDGDPGEFAGLYQILCNRFPQLTVLGGCCGTDQRHIDAVRHACCQ
jgi:S-methylmethionine-dependent homocysteine/selenocysteine methylase